jgi:D-inositol-3-phosphate glycosyltransferase
MNGLRSERLRIGMLCGYRPTPAGGGTEKHVYELTRGLLARGVEVEIVCEDRPFLPDADNPLAAHIAGILPERSDGCAFAEQSAKKSRRLAAAINPARYDIIHNHSHYGFHTALRVRELTSRPLFVSTFHLTARGPIERYKQLGLAEPAEAADDRAVALMEETVGRLSDQCIAVSRGVAQEMVELYALQPQCVEVIANWYDAAIFRPSAMQSARRLLGLESDARYLLYVGHFAMSRGQTMAQALRELPSDVTLLVVDHKVDAGMLDAFGSRMRFTGQLTPRMLALYYSAADLLCFPSLYGGFGLVLIEAMACGCPPVAFDYPAMNEVVRPDCGYLVSTPTPAAYAAAIAEALADGRKKAAAAEARAHQFNMDKQIDRVLGLYRQLTWRFAKTAVL